jgi:RimJ/RimL family protein N-acetyltransferase
VTLLDPTPGVRVSYLDACTEYAAEDPSGHGLHARLNTAVLADPGAFDRYCRALRSGVFDWQHTTGPPVRVWWWCVGGVYVGEATLHPTLPPTDPGAGGEPAGHIGYQIRPSARGQGHGTRLLAAVIGEAHATGLDPVTLTVGVGNAASVAVMRRVGAVEVARVGAVGVYLA